MGFYYCNNQLILTCVVVNPVVMTTKNVVNTFSGPKHIGKHLHMIIKDKLKEKRLNQELTNAVIMAFEVKSMHPVIFSSYEVKKNPDLDAKFSDICIGTSAAPVYLPAHKFQTKDSEGNILREFNLIDGAVIANNLVGKTF
ncbi:putative patatin-like phospholipase domain, Acyl transferase/acyl hydrolase/lysophospholipase [Helianthus annuus]|nr:putative patatin-like phospholipase domain, Acyl transferase/acyl hydrolase/lysophospholipase [Helianthus annuus]